MRTWLLPLAGGKPIEIVKDMLLVGRQDSCDLALDHKTVSKTHCVLAKAEGRLLLRDLGSTNGCRINGQRMQRGALHPSDVLAIAVYEYRVHLSNDEPSGAEIATPGSDRTEMISLPKDLKMADSAAD